MTLRQIRIEESVLPALLGLLSCSYSFSPYRAADGNMENENVASDKMPTATCHRIDPAIENPLEGQVTSDAGSSIGIVQPKRLERGHDTA